MTWKIKWRKRLSCPVCLWGIQEDLVRDRGFEHRKLDQMACRRILNFALLLGRMLERPNSPNSGGDRDTVDVILLCSNNEIKVGRPVSPSPGFGSALSPNDRGSGLYFLSGREGVCCPGAGWLHIQSAGLLHGLAWPLVRRRTRRAISEFPQPWSSARHWVT